MSRMNTAQPGHTENGSAKPVLDTTNVAETIDNAVNTLKAHAKVSEE